MYVKPNPALTIRDPDLRDYLPEEGREVPDTHYWRRRLRDGDVVSVSAPKASKVSKALKPPVTGSDDK